MLDDTTTASLLTPTSGGRTTTPIEQLGISELAPIYNVNESSNDAGSHRPTESCRRSAALPPPTRAAGAVVAAPAGGSRAGGFDNSDDGSAPRAPHP
jgi:hypothetical protein